MCIMFIKDYDQEFPSDETMKICWDDNRDGAGYAWYDKDIKEWRVVKGLMTWDIFLREFNNDRQEYSLDDKTVIVHFRVGTSGPEIGGATHPFPAVATWGVDVNTLRYTCKGVFFHNGTIGQGTKEYSDTQVATMDYVQPMVRHIFEDKEPDEHLLDILCEILRTNVNRYVITHGKDIRYLGKWVKDEQSGLMYSNDRYKEDNTRYVAAAAREKAQKSYLADIKARAQNTSIHSDRVIYELAEERAKVNTFVDAQGQFVWDMWDNRYNAKAKPSETIAVYGKDGDVKYTVTREEGEVEAWDVVEPESEPVQGTISCLSCNLFVLPKDLINGECPGCGTVLDPEGLTTVVDQNPRSYECPTCDATMTIELTGYESIIIANRDKGLDDFCQCHDCGCVWAYNKNENPWVIGYIGQQADGDTYFTECGEGKAVG